MRKGAVSSLTNAVEKLQHKLYAEDAAGLIFSIKTDLSCLGSKNQLEYRLQAIASVKGS